jgi:hypothetical protein
MVPRMSVLLRLRIGAALLLLQLVGCQRVDPLTGAEKLDHATCDFGIYWPPVDAEVARPTAVKPLLNGILALDATKQASGAAEVRLVVTLTRPSTEADRERWNSVLAFADIPWMDQVRYWDAEEKWLWPNLPYLLRLPGQERVERYGGVDPGKGIDNDFAAVLIRKYDARGAVESAETKDAPLVSGEWHAVGATDTDLHSVVHVAQSDEFRLHLGGDSGPARGQLRVWLIYADFLKAKPPQTWPTPGEWAGGILAYFEIDWEVSPELGCRGIVRHKRPPESTRFEWAKWVVHTPDSDESRAETRLSDLPTSR